MSRRNVTKHNSTSEYQVKIRYQHQGAHAQVFLTEDKGKKELVEIGSMQLANANDINRDNINDALDRDLINNELKRQKIEADKKVAQDKLELDREKAILEKEQAQRDYEIAMEDLRIKEIAAKRPIGK